MQSRIDTIKRDNGEMQRFQVVQGFSWEDLEFVSAPFSKAVFDEMHHIYRDFVVKKNPELYGALLMYYLPPDMEQPFPFDTRYGRVFDPQTAAAVGLRTLAADGRLVRNGDGVSSGDEAVDAFLSNLGDMGWLAVVHGDRDDVNVMPFSSDLGYLSERTDEYRFICNSHFFEMDLLDSDSPYDLFGTPYGLTLKDGVATRPPLHGREAFLVRRDGKVEIRYPDVLDMDIAIGGKVFRHGTNATIYRRPIARNSRIEAGQDIVVVGDKVVAVHEGGGVDIPAGGFVIHTLDSVEEKPHKVEYLGFEDYVFGLQVGSSAVKDGKVMEDFESPFFDYRKDPIAYPPSMYPLSYSKDRAPRMALCSNKDDAPFFVWSEGCSKLRYEFGKESCGASLLEEGEYCHGIGAWNAINLDGGGSSEIFIDGRMLMHVSDRHPDNSDSERPVPIGIGIR